MQCFVGVFCLVIFCNNLSAVLSARILAVFLSSAPSHHYSMFQPMLKTLVGAGHEVVAYTPRPLKNPPTNYTNVFVEEFLEDEELILLEIISKHYKYCSEYDGSNRTIQWFEKFMASKEIRLLLNKSHGHFDIIVTEPFLMQDYVLILGHIFKVPVVAVSTFMAVDALNSVTGNPLEIAYIPDLCAPRTNDMSFFDRLHNSHEILRRLYYFYNYHMPLMDSKMRRYFPDMPPLLEMMRNLSLVFINEHPTAWYARPLAPNVIPVGGINIGTSAAKPLPEDIRTFIEEASDGLIFFSLGSLVPETANSIEFYDTFRYVFGQLRQRVLWKTKRVIPGLPDNVKISPWLPQQDILAHKNCKLFITHGGLHSLFEAVHFGVPLITVPYFGDQRSNGMFGVAKGIGLMIERADLSNDSLTTAIATVLGDSSYAKNVAKLSSVFRDPPMTPAQSVVYWVNHVLRHSGHHLRPPLLPLYKAYMLDVIAAASVACLVTLTLVAKLVATLIQRGKWPNRLRSAKKHE